MHTTHRPRFEHEIAAMREALLAGDDPHAPAHAPPPPAASPAALAYQSGFGNHFESEAVVGALPREQNSPQFVPFSLYAEQLSGAAFTTPRALNAHTWMYRLDPSVKHGRAAPRAHARLQSDFAGAAATVSPDQLRWTPLPLPGAGEVVDWVDGLVTLCGAGSAEAKDGLAIHLYACNAPMRRGAAGVDSCGGRSFCNADGDLLIVPQAGGLLLTTELGRLHVDVGEVAVVPRNIVFAIDPQGAPPAAGAHAAPAGGEGGEGEGEDGEAAARGCRGYVLETFSDRHLAPAERGPIGANGMAEARHFLYPHAWFEDEAGDFVTTCKSQGLLFDRARSHSPFDVVAWHGSYAPCKYALRRFVALGSVSVDHPDPSVLTVLSLPGGAADGGGRSAVDFAIFPPRWLCAERTFRPPYFHRNCCAEFMGLIDGSYDAKVGFVPGASSLHNVGVPHGPDAATYRMALDGETSTPLHFKNGTAFMFETAHPLKLTAFAAASMDASYAACWEGLPRAPAPHHVYAAGQPHAAGHYRRRAGTSGANAVTLPHAAELAAMRAHVGP